MCIRDRSGDYIVRGFDIDLREHYDDGLNDGVFTNVGGIDGTGDGGDSTKIAIGLSPGKAYVRGYEIGTQGQTFVPLNKARSTDFIQNNPTTFSACLLYTSPSPRDRQKSRMPSSA